MALCYPSSFHIPQGRAVGLQKGVPMFRTSYNRPIHDVSVLVKQGGMRRLAAPIVAAVAALGLACSESSPHPVQPSAITPLGPLAVRPAVLPDSHGQQLIAVVGEGEGVLNITPKADRPGFSVEIQVALRKTNPDTTFTLARAVDFTLDGVCTNTNFVPLPLPNPGPLVLLTTSPGGAGAAHVSFALDPVQFPQFSEGRTFEVHWEIRAIDSSVVLRSDCFRVTVK
jgi:hypothetical protein